MTDVPTSSAARFLGLAGAILLISSSAALGAYYGFTVGAHQHLALGLIFGAAALGGEILKPFAVAGMVDALRSCEFLRALSCLALAFVCIVYSLAAELSLAAGSRGDMASARQVSADTIKNVRERRTRAATELGQIAPARAPSELAPLVAKLKATPGVYGCEGPPDGPLSRKVCGDALSMQAEAARAVRRAELEAVISEMDRAIAERAGLPAPTVADADPLASALSAYLSALGRKVEPDTLAPWLALIPVLFLEFGSALSLIVVRQIGAADRTGRGAAAPVAATSPARDHVPPVAPVASGGPSAPPATVQPAPIEPDTPTKPRRTRDDDRRGPKGGRRLDNVVDLIKARGGKVQDSQRDIAKALGLSKSRANELLHELAASGFVRLATGRHGTMIELATA